MQKPGGNRRCDGIFVKKYSGGIVYVVKSFLIKAHVTMRLPAFPCLVNEKK